MSVNGEEADGDEEATSGEIEERIEDFKQDKARQKSSFTRIKNKLLRMVDEQDYPSRREIKELCQQLSDAQESAMETMTRLSMEYALLKDREKRKKVVEEMDKLELEFSEANEKAQEYLDARKDELSSRGESCTWNESDASSLIDSILDVKKFENGRRSAMSAAGRRPKLQSKLWHPFHRSDFGCLSDL